MNSETILTYDQIDRIIEGVAWPSEEIAAFGHDVARDIEQAVLQSPEIRALRKDAELYRWLRDTLHNAKAGGGVEVNDALQVYETPVHGEEVRVYWYPDTPVGFYQSVGSTLDAAINAAMEQQT